MSPDDWIALGLTPRARFTFSLILARAFSVSKLRSLAKSHGTKPKGFRVDKAGADQLANALGEDFIHNEALRKGVADALVERFADSPDTAAAPDPETAVRSAEIERLRVENERLRARVAKLEQSATRATRSRDEAIEERTALAAERVRLEARTTALERELEKLRTDQSATRAVPRDSNPQPFPVDRDFAQLEERDRARSVSGSPS